jgi:predicted peroxiredoxin
MVLLTIEGVCVATRGYADGLPAKGFAPLSELLAQYVNNDGRLWVCGACAKPRDITEADLVPGARIVGATTTVEALVNGAQTLSF